MKRNHKSDLDFIFPVAVCIPQADGSCTRQDIGWPSFDWSATFWTWNRSVSFTASCKGGVPTNCFNDNNRIHIVAPDHGLGPGTLSYELRCRIPSDIFPSGSRLEVNEAELGAIELIHGTGDCGVDADAEALLPILWQSAYTLAVQGGYGGTMEEYQQALTAMPDAVAKVEAAVADATAQIEAVNAAVSEAREGAQDARAAAAEASDAAARAATATARIESMTLEYDGQTGRFYAVFAEEETI